MLAHILGQKLRGRLIPLHLHMRRIFRMHMLPYFVSRKEERRLGSMLFPAFKLQKILRAKVLLLARGRC